MTGMAPRVVTTDLSQETMTKIGRQWHDVCEHLLFPGVSWAWAECELSPALKNHLREKGLIVRDPSGERWVTTERLWLYVIERADPDETVGTGGQQILARSSNSSRNDTWRLNNDPAGVMQ